MSTPQANSIQCVTAAENAFASAYVYRELKAILDESVAAPDRRTCTDVAIAPYQRDEFERLSLYHDTTGGEAALARK